MTLFFQRFQSRVDDQTRMVQSAAIVLMILVNMPIWADEPVSPAEQVKRLEELAELRSANRDKILRWEGNAEVDLSFTDDGVTLRRVAKVRFVYDLARNAEEYAFKVVDWTVDPPDTKKFVSQLGHTSGTLMLDSSDYQLRISDWKSQPKDSILIYPRKIPSINSFGTQFYPFHLMGIETGPEDEKIRMWQKYLGPGFDWFESRLTDLEPHKLEFRCRVKELPIKVWWIGKFDISNCGGLVHSVQEIPNVEKSEYEITYERFGEISVPATWRHVISRPGKQNMVSIKITRQTVNSDLPPDAFTLEFMGVRPGADLIDDATGETSTYTPDEKSTTNTFEIIDPTSYPIDDKIPVPEPSSKPTTESNLHSIQNIMFGLLGLALVACAVSAVLRRIKK